MRGVARELGAARRGARRGGVHARARGAAMGFFKKKRAPITNAAGVAAAAEKQAVDVRLTKKKYKLEDEGWKCVCARHGSALASAFRGHFAASTRPRVCRHPHTRGCSLS